MKDCHAPLHSARNDSTLIHIVMARKNDEAIYQHITGIVALSATTESFAARQKNINKRNL